MIGMVMPSNPHNTQKKSYVQDDIHHISTQDAFRTLVHKSDNSKCYGFNGWDVIPDIR